MDGAMAAFWAGLMRGLVAALPLIRKVKAERDTGANPNLAQQNRTEALLDEALRRLGSISHTDPIWQKIRIGMVATIVRPDHFSNPYVRDWLSLHNVKESLKHLARSLLVAAPEPEGIREASIAAYIEISGENRSRAEDCVQIAVAFLKASVQAAANDPGVAAIAQEGFQAVNSQLEGIHQKVDRLVSTQDSCATVEAPASLSLVELRQLAKALLDAGSPPALAALFPDAQPAANAALRKITNIQRTVLKVGSETDKTPQRNTLPDLVVAPARKHLIVGQPGSGKTHALWHMADRLLQEEGTIPLFLPVGHLTTWQQVTAIISDLCPNISPETALRDHRVCICVDGWSEFAMGEHIGEKAKALRVLCDARVIANARHADVGDTTLDAWVLEPLSQQLVIDTLELTCHNEMPIPSKLLDLLRFPLLLSLFVLSGGSTSEIGELLRQFHDRLARNLPEGFSEALSGAVAAVTLAGDRSYGRLISELQSQAKAVQISEPKRLLESLGTIVSRAGQAIPVHDLYWSWLCGCGLLMESRATEAIRLLQTRESYILALQSGQRAAPSLITELVENDLLLAADLDFSINSQNPHPALAAALDQGFADNRLAIRNRAALASLRCSRPQYLRRTLATISELSEARLLQPEWLQALMLNGFFTQRSTLAEWLGSPGSDLILDVIAARGGPEWVHWLEQMATSGKITPVAALAAALACNPAIPDWGRPHLNDLFRTAPWKLRCTAIRRSNIELARQIALNYEQLIETVITKNSSAWIDLNRVLVSCGDDTVFNLLISQFEHMGAKSQELLEYAVVERGGIWVSQFQKIAFSAPGKKHHHKLVEIISTDIDDETARKWIATGYDQIGWRVLISRHGEVMLPELVADLPISFDGLHHIPSLANMRFLESAPETLVNEIWSRVKGQIQPKAMQDVLVALSKVEIAGMDSIVRFLINTPDALGAYHIAQALRLYEGWRKRTNTEIRIKTAEGEFLFQHWIARHCALNNWEPHSTSTMLSEIPELAIDLALNDFKDDQERAAEILSKLKSVKIYHAGLFSRMIAEPKLAALIPRVFADCFDTFPQDTILQAISSPDIDEDELMWRLSATSNPMHRPAHIRLIKRTIAQDINIHHYRYLADMLRGHSRHDVIAILEETTQPRDNNTIWLIRQIESARGELLINEAGYILP